MRLKAKCHVSVWTGAQIRRNLYKTLLVQPAKFDHEQLLDNDTNANVINVKFPKSDYRTVDMEENVLVLRKYILKCLG